ncbi:MAG: porin [Leptospiraceae bacterium]|nr:porin [Leptospiraceae bacterium]MCP5494446.1 porin [Leptospiraceae bacterium]
MRSRVKLFSILTFMVSTLGVFAEEAAAPAEKKWYDKVEVSGFVDVYYQYITNNKQGGGVDSSRTFETYNKQFAVNSVELDLEKVATADSRWGFRIDFMNGQNAMFQERPFYTTNQAFNMNLLQQAYVSMYFPIMKGLTIDVGKMATHIGYEVLESKDNLNYTIGYIFFNTVPFIHTGARASLSMTDKWSLGLYLYNSAQGTGYTGNNAQFATLQSSQLTDISNHVYVDGPNKARAVGTQLKGHIIPDKFDLVWNTVYGNDNVTSRQSNMENFIATNVPALTPNPGPSSFKTDYWFVNNVILAFSPNEKMSISLDWTHGIRSGQTITNAAGYINDGFSDPIGGTGLNGLGRDGKYTKKIYNTYGVWFKYIINPKLALGLRYENIDDSRYGGALAVNPPGAFTTPAYRYDLQYQESNFGRPATSKGQAKTFTITPIYNFSENLVIKLDLRRDWALGNQFVDEKGRPAHYQNGATLGLVAKF